MGAKPSVAGVLDLLVDISLGLWSVRSVISSWLLDADS